MRIEPSITPAATRLPIGAPATLRHPGRPPIDVAIQDLSAAGALLKTAAVLPVGSLVTIPIPGIGLRLAQITRAESRALTCSFLPPLVPADVERARGQAMLVTVAIPQLPVERAGVSPWPAAITETRATDPPRPELLLAGAALHRNAPVQDVARLAAAGPVARQPSVLASDAAHPAQPRAALGGSGALLALAAAGVLIHLLFG